MVLSSLGIDPLFRSFYSLGSLRLCPQFLSVTIISSQSFFDTKDSKFPLKTRAHSSSFLHSRFTPVSSLFGTETTSIARSPFLGFHLFVTLGSILRPSPLALRRLFCGRKLLGTCYLEPVLGIKEIKDLSPFLWLFAIPFHSIRSSLFVS
jgi:hypothetical protein